jgi:hypothetical protein
MTQDNMVSGLGTKKFKSISTLIPLAIAIDLPDMEDVDL